MKKLNVCFVYIFLLFSSSVLFAQSNTQSKGETLFKENNAKEAVEVLEYEILNGEVSANTYNFLGLGYYQIGEYSKSIDAFNRGLKVQPALFKLLKYNQGNTYYVMKDFTSAVNCYSEVLKEYPDFYDAKLNRANALLMANQLMNARDEYIDYLVKCPADPQKNEIEALIKALTDEIKRREEEERRLAESEKARWEMFEDTIPEYAEEKKEDEKKPDWEKVEAAIAEEKKEPEPEVETPSEEKKPDWEQVETAIAEENKQPKPEPPAEEKRPDWEKVESSIAEEKTPVEKKPDWEKVNEQVAVTKEEETPAEPVKESWEKVDSTEKTVVKEYEKVEQEKEIVDWQDLSTEDSDELKELDERSRKEYLAWLEEQKRLKEEKLAEEKRRREANLNNNNTKESEEAAYREKLMLEMLRADNERKQKLLEEVANSLQNSESTNMSAGLDDMIDYTHEGELD